MRTRNYPSICFVLLLGVLANGCATSLQRVHDERVDDATLHQLAAELASANNDGTYRKPVAVTIVTDSSDTVLYENTGQHTSVYGNEYSVSSVQVEDFEAVCHAPCNKVIEAGNPNNVNLNKYFKLDGSYILESDWLTLYRYNNRAVRVNVHGGSAIQHGLGVFLTDIGGISIGGGALGLLAGGLFDSSQSLKFGIITGGSGLAALIVGIVLRATANTSYEIEPLNLH